MSYSHAFSTLNDPFMDSFTGPSVNLFTDPSVDSFTDLPVEPSMEPSMEPSVESSNPGMHASNVDMMPMSSLDHDAAMTMTSLSLLSPFPSPHIGLTFDDILTDSKMLAEDDPIPKCYITSIPIDTIYRFYAHEGVTLLRYDIVDAIPYNIIPVSVDTILEGIAKHLELRSAATIEEIVKIMEETHTYSLCDLNVFITDGYMFVKFVSTPEITALQTKVHKLLTAILMSSRGSMTVEKTNSLYTKRKIDST